MKHKVLLQRSIVIMNTPNANRIHTFKKHPVHTASTGKKAAVANVSKWKRTHLNAVSPEEKQDIEAKVKAALVARAKIGADFVVGFNSVMRLVQTGQAAVVCVAQDGHQAMLKVLVESAQVKAVPTVTIPKLNQSMRSVFGLRSASCFALKRMNLEEEMVQLTESNETTTDGDNADEEKHHCHTKSAVVDDLRDYLLSLQ